MPEHTPPLVDQAFQRLRRDVLTGTFAANAKLKVEELQEAYGFSSSPLREALSRLSQEGLVRADERRGFRVAPGRHHPHAADDGRASPARGHRTRR
jgi:DNA-binding GntR family transcriptional regulator